jgi:hypothetical protein
MFRFLFRPQRPTAVTVRPLLEMLEDRLVPAARYVVPIGVPANPNATTPTFYSLANALDAPGLKAGDSIVIDTGSDPGNVTDSDLTAPGVANLTIEGDPNQILANIPQFTISNPGVIGTAETGLTLQNVNIGLVDTGSLSYEFISGSLIGSSLVNESTSSLGVGFSVLGSGNIVKTTMFVNEGTISNCLVNISPNGGSNNQIIGNTFEAVGPTACLLEYTNFTETNYTVTDQIQDNSFLTTLPSSTTGTETMLSVGVGLGVVAGLTIQSNSFSGVQDLGGNMTAIQLNAEAQNIIISNNTINLAPNGTGIQIVGGTSGTTLTSATINTNRISTGNGVALNITTGSATTNVVDADVEGNDFNNNQIGVAVLLTSANSSVSGIDLGGGSQGSPGGNDFRSFTTAGTALSGAVVADGPAPAAAQFMIMQDDIFAAGAGSSFSPLSSLTGPSGGIDLGLTNSLTGNSAFVETLYAELLGRPGNFNVSNDITTWVNYLNNNTLTATQVVDDIATAPEAAQALVDGLYLRIMHTPGTTQNTAKYVSMAEAGTVAPVIQGMLTSYFTTAPLESDAAFVESLYSDLLGRVGTNAEVAGWVTQLQAHGASVVMNGFITSLEFESDVVEQLYGFTLAPAISVASVLPPALHRTAAPPAAQINGWASAGLDMVTLEEDFLNTSEFFSNG